MDETTLLLLLGGGAVLAYLWYQNSQSGSTTGTTTTTTTPTTTAATPGTPVSTPVQTGSPILSYAPFRTSMFQGQMKTGQMCATSANQPLAAALLLAAQTANDPNLINNQMTGNQWDAYAVQLGEPTLVGIATSTQLAPEMSACDYVALRAASGITVSYSTGTTIST